MTHSPATGYLGRPQVWVIMNKAAITTRVQVLSGHRFRILWVNTKEQDSEITW